MIGPPALAATAMEQGRRAVRHALGLEPGDPPRADRPSASTRSPRSRRVGSTEAEAHREARRRRWSAARASTSSRAARSTATTDGLLKLVADADGTQLLGAHIVGEGATELIHVGQMAMLAGLEVDAFVDNIFNFPTLAEAYRVAALDIAEQRARDSRGRRRRSCREPFLGPALALTSLGSSRVLCPIGA